MHVAHAQPRGQLPTAQQGHRDRFTHHPRGQLAQGRRGGGEQNARPGLLAAAAASEITGDHGGEPELLDQLGNDTNRTLVVTGNEKRKALLTRQVRVTAVAQRLPVTRCPARTKSFAAVAPMWPAPMIPMSMVAQTPAREHGISVRVLRALLSSWALLSTQTGRTPRVIRRDT